jgi:hypothetical protein
MAEYDHIAGKPRQWRVKLPPSSTGRTLVAKTCRRCGELRLSSQFNTANGKMNGNPCRFCQKATRAALPAKRLGRPLVAATCHKCGCLKSASEFAAHSKRETVETRCKACVSKAAANWAAEHPDQTKEKAAKLRRKWNDAALDRARRHGSQWTGVELETVLRDDLTARQKAEMLGRSLFAVRSAIRRARYEPKWAKVAGVDDA